MSSSKDGSWFRYGKRPAGPSWPMIASPCQSRRSNPMTSSSCAIVTRGTPITSNSMSKPRPSPSVNRPPVRRCIVVPNVAVTSTWRVLWFVAAVATPSVVLTAPAAPLQRARVLGVEALRDEDRPQPDVLGPPDLGHEIPGRRRMPGQPVEPQLVQLLHPRTLPTATAPGADGRNRGVAGHCGQTGSAGWGMTSAGSADKRGVRTAHGSGATSRGARVRRDAVAGPGRSGRGVRRGHPPRHHPAVPGRGRRPDRGADRHDQRHHDHPDPRHRRRPQRGRHLHRRRRPGRRRGRRRSGARSTPCGEVARRSRRVASVCSGAFILAEGRSARRPPGHDALGVAVAGSRASTPSSTSTPIRSSCATATSTRPPASPRASTSASRSSKRTTAATSRSSVARQLVVFLKRPGGQAQFSSHLSTQLADRDVLADVQGWIADHLDDDLSVARARRPGRHEPPPLRPGLPGRDRRDAGAIRRARAGRAGARAGSRSPARASRRSPTTAASAPPRRCAGRSCGRSGSGPSEYRQRFRATADPTVEV